MRATFKTQSAGGEQQNGGSVTGQNKNSLKNRIL